MPLQFAGPASSLDEEAIEKAARDIGCRVAAVRAVIDVESRGGFLADKRPKILFERHYFSRLTKRRYDRSHPAISQPGPGGYKGGRKEYDRLAQAIDLDRDAALRSASWGAFQIMGDNYRICGFDDVEDFVSAMVSGEPAQLRAFVAFVKSSKLDAALIRRDWAQFARGYNGPAYRANRYDEKLEASYRFHAASDPHASSARPLLRQGDRGDPVRAVQNLLHILADGYFGPITRRAVIAFQKSKDLSADGLVGEKTWAALAAN